MHNNTPPLRVPNFEGPTVPRFLQDGRVSGTLGGPPSGPPPNPHQHEMHMPGMGPPQAMPPQQLLGHPAGSSSLLPNGNVPLDPRRQPPAGDMQGLKRKQDAPPRVGQATILLLACQSPAVRWLGRLNHSAAPCKHVPFRL